MTFLVLFSLLCQILENEHFTYKSLNIYSCKFSPKTKEKYFLSFIFAHTWRCFGVSGIASLHRIAH